MFDPQSLNESAEASRVMCAPSLFKICKDCENRVVQPCPRTFFNGHPAAN